MDGSTSNNKAKYDVLISGLKICLAQKIQRLIVKGDALLIVKQILGIWACKNERLRIQVTNIRKLFSQFEEVQLYHIPRKENEDANLLAQQGVSNQDKAHVLIAAISLKDPQYTDEENKIEDEGDMSQAAQQVLPIIDEETPFHKGDAMSTQEVVEHESDFVAQKPSNDMNKGSENMLPTIGEAQIHEGNTRNSEEKMVVVENQSDVQTSPKPSDDMIIKDTYSMPLRDEEVKGSEKKDEANEEHQGALATTEVQDKVDKGTREATRNANKAQSIQGRVQGTEGEREVEEREIQERLRREEEEKERKILEHLRREEEEEERKILEHLRRQEKEEAQKKEEPAVHYKRPRRHKYLDPYFMDEL
ncbi:hypothetical protein L7F22_038377 [Adiantum nelumboides]|nr:hypothetical protein [Adiantum nelumboides]